MLTFALANPITAALLVFGVALALAILVDRLLCHVETMARIKARLPEGQVHAIQPPPAPPRPRP